MYDVHLNIGPPGGEVNPLALSPIGFKDTISPTIEKDGIQRGDEHRERWSCGAGCLGYGAVVSCAKAKNSGTMVTSISDFGAVPATELAR